VAGNYVSGAPVYDECTGALGSYGRNKFWGVSSCTITQLGAGDYTLLLSLDELGGLQDNGGPTQTIALVSPSDMIDGAEVNFGCIDKNAACSSPTSAVRRGSPACAVTSARSSTGPCRSRRLRRRWRSRSRRLLRSRGSVREPLDRVYREQRADGELHEIAVDHPVVVAGGLGARRGSSRAGTGSTAKPAGSGWPVE